jgi:hypothetical protein
MWRRAAPTRYASRAATATRPAANWMSVMVGGVLRAFQTMAVQNERRATKGNWLLVSRQTSYDLFCHG